MAESHVVSALISKRAEMAGLIEHQQKEMGRLADDLAHLDATLRLFFPEDPAVAPAPGVFPVRHLVGVVVAVLRSHKPHCASGRSGTGGSARSTIPRGY